MTWWPPRPWLYPAPYGALYNGKRNPVCLPGPNGQDIQQLQLAGHKDNWIDFNAGRMVEDMTKEELAKELLNYVLAVASGRKVKSEEAGFHDMAIFKQGVDPVEKTVFMAVLFMAVLIVISSCISWRTEVY